MAENKAVWMNLKKKGATTVKQMTEILKQLTMLTQFGLSLITPTLMCLGICWWLCSRFQIGAWIYIPGFFFGLGGSGTVAYRLYQSVMKQHHKEKKKDRISFNRHE
ncbi:MAG: AtpZ/AtpI family protein [Eubacteriales bacterium]|nr:AtpZ/AtpI family protein [Eubacteriales bacterium]